MGKIDILEKFSKISAFWNPKIVGELNGQLIKLSKFKGEFIWHHHENEDELFMVVKGELILEFRDRIVTLHENEFIIVPKNVEHKPIAKEEVWVMLFKPSSTLNTGTIVDELTQPTLDRI